MRGSDIGIIMRSRGFRRPFLSQTVVWIVQYNFSITRRLTNNAASAIFRESRSSSNFGFRSRHGIELDGIIALCQPLLAIKQEIH
jgi:hypothetical protein